MVSSCLMSFMRDFWERELYLDTLSRIAQGLDAGIEDQSFF